MNKISNAGFLGAGVGMLVSRTGKLITAWTSANYDNAMIEIVEKLCGE